MMFYLLGIFCSILCNLIWCFSSILFQFEYPGVQRFFCLKNMIKGNATYLLWNFYLFDKKLIVNYKIIQLKSFTNWVNWLKLVKISDKMSYLLINVLKSSMSISKPVYFASKGEEMSYQSKSLLLFWKFREWTY